VQRDSTLVDRGLARAFAEAMAAKDHAALRALLRDEVDFRALTPSVIWEGSCPKDVVNTVAVWFDVGDVIENVESVETDRFADLERVGYRFRVRTEGEAYLVEQQAYLVVQDGRIAWLRVMCSGFCRVEP
jgi:ketosteroid isomerase-like protein